MRQLKAVTPDTVRAAAELYRRAWENGARSTAGSAGAIQANADLYDVILNPFGAKDASQTKLTDVTEGTEEYEAIRYMYENGFLAAVSEDAFGAAEAAKVEDLAAAFYMALGGTAGATEEAVETLSGLGLIPADWTADTELTGAMAQQFVQSFSALAGAEIGIELPEGASDRALTRGELAVVLYPLFSKP